MASDNHEVFDASAYWRDRVVSGSDLSIVGHRSLGNSYNVEIYSRRLEVLDMMLARHTDKPINELRVLDIGCGSGFYTAYWKARGISDYLGLDISSETIGHLSQLYPDYDFIHGDITSESPNRYNISGTFDLITIFDVFYHIVDDDRFATSVGHIGNLVAEQGCVMVMDQLCSKRYQLSKHVVYRARDEYMERFHGQKLALADTELLFHYLIPPITGNRLVDYVAAATFKLTGLVVSRSPRLAAWIAAKMLQLDARQREKGRVVSNSEMLVFRKSRRWSGK